MTGYLNCTHLARGAAAGASSMAVVRTASRIDNQNFQRARTMSKHTPLLQLEDVLDDKYMTTIDACAQLDMAMQTLHNKVSAGTAPCRPVGKLQFGRANFNIWLRADIRAWEIARNNAPTMRAYGR